MRILPLPAAVVLALSSAFLSTAAAEPSVSLELATAPGVPITAPQQWIAALRDAGFSNIRVRQGAPADRPEVITRGEGATASYLAVGIVTSQNVLHLPGGGRFTMADRAGVATWVTKLKGGGQEGLTARPAAFGLVAKEIVALHESLAAPVGIATKGQKASAVVNQIQRGLKVLVTIDPLAQRALAGEGVVSEELQAVSSGTALAAILRPLGLVIVPRKAAGGIELAVLDFRATEESWPVGWPPEKEVRDVLPKLTEFLTVEIDQTPLAEALGALEKRLETPILFDHNSLARQKIDPAAIKVSMPEGKTYYKKILERILFQAKLTMEVRVDEAGRPLIWVSTLKR